MPKTIAKTMMITRVTYKTVEVVDGEARFVDHTDAIFSGILEKEKVERMLRAQMGKDAMIVVTSIDAGQHRYEMDLDTFVLNARIADGEPEETPEEDGESDSASTPAPDPAPACDPVPNPVPADAPSDVPVTHENSADGEKPADAAKGETDEEDDGVEPF